MCIRDRPSAGKVLIGTVKGDLHDIGKNLVAIMLESSGFDVINLGVDVAPDEFVEAVKEHQPQIVGLSALLTTTMLVMKETIDYLKEEGLRDKVKICLLYTSIVGLLGTIMSTLDSYYLTAGMTLVKDLYGRISKKEITEKRMVSLTRVGIALSAVVGLLLALQFEMVIEAWIMIGGLFIAGAFVPVICGIFWPWKRTLAGGTASMVVGLGARCV